jgi:hypothetical protein
VPFGAHDDVSAPAQSPAGSARATPMDLLVESALKRAARQPGCVLCRVGEEAAARYLSSVLGEGTTDPATRGRLDRSWGFCRRHAWHFLGLEWERMRDSLGTATLSETLVEGAENLLKTYLEAQALYGQRSRSAVAALDGLTRAMTPAEACPACQVQAEHEGYAAKVLVRALGDPEWRKDFSASDGLCLHHLRRALAGEEAPQDVQWLVEDQRRRLHEIRADLEEYGRKHDYRFSHEAFGREVAAAIRATEALAGSWFNLPHRPRPAPERERGAAGLKQGGHDNG